MCKKREWWVITIWSSYEENGIELVSFVNLYWENRHNKLRVIKAKIDNEKQINKMNKQIFYSLKLQDENKKQNFIYWNEC